jgi:hypothetical protein
MFEPEFATCLRRMKSETNTLSPVLRAAWDDGNLSTLTKNSPDKATNAHVSVIAHTTAEELVTTLTETDRANGFANRFMFFLVKRSKYLPEPRSIPESDLMPFITQLREVARWAYKPRVMVEDEEARALWAVEYTRLSQTGPAYWAPSRRPEAHVLRLSVLYAILDQSPVITVRVSVPRWPCGTTPSAARG